MYWIAFSLGFLGSLHCIGMCGPLAIAVHTYRNNKKFMAVLDTISYNSGRTVSYILLGLIFGGMGHLMVMGVSQRSISIGLGGMLLVIFLFTIKTPNMIANVRPFRQFYSLILQTLSTLLKKSTRIPMFYFGMVNGLLPCGLVYVAIAGALTMSNIWGGAGFMLFFGLGTFPAMMSITFGYQHLSQNIKRYLMKIYPFITLLMGIYLIYRGIMSKFPLALNFFQALQNPVMCH